MPRSARLDAPDALHHVIGRGIERRNICRDDVDRGDFISRLGRLAENGAIAIYAWALLPNHFHLLCKTKAQPLSVSMHRLLTGYVVNFNKRHRRHGHLFQNRFKSIVCQENRYLKELVRYIHLNPLRCGLVANLDALEAYPYCGHSTMTGKRRLSWQESGHVLSLFGKSLRESQRAYRDFVAAGAGLGWRPELVGGGWVRSLGGWSEVTALRRRSRQSVCDQRILGDNDFICQVIGRMNDRQRCNLRLTEPKPEIASLCRHICVVYEVSPGELRSGSRRRPAVLARSALAWIAVRELGFSGADVARYIGVTNSCITRSVAAGCKPDVDNILARLEIESTETASK